MTRKTKDKVLLGTKKTATLSKNCGLCKKYLYCSDPSKSIRYLCSFYSNKNTDLPALKTTPKKSPVSLDIYSLEGRTQKDYKRFSTMMDKLLLDQESNPVPADITIDDRDFPQAANFYEWVCDPKFLGLAITPFAKQLQIGTNLFAEFCPRCSNPKYFKADPQLQLEMPVRMSPKKYLENVQLLRHGKCPKCHARRSEMVKSNELPVYNELVGVAGQRASKCVVADTILHTGDGFVDIFSMLKHAGTGVQPYSGNMTTVDEQGTLHPLTATYRSEIPETVYDVEVNNGFSVAGTENHPLFSFDCFYKIKDLNVGEVLTMFVGQDTWPTVQDDPNLATVLAVSMGSPALLNSIARSRNFPYRADLILALQSVYPNHLIAKNDHARLSADKIKELESQTRVSVPRAVMTGSREFVRTFLSTLFTLAADSFVGGITYCSVSPTAAKHLSYLLHNFGVFCRVDGNTVFIEGQLALKTFFDRVGLLCPTKEQQLLDGISHRCGGLSKKRAPLAWYEVVPQGFAARICKHLGLETVLTFRHSLIRHCLRFQQTDNACPMVRSFLHCLLNPNLAFVQVQSKQARPEPEYTFDITVDKVHRFIGNGLLQHNSTTFAMLATYCTHGFIKLQNPASFYGLMPNQMLHGQLTALTWAAAIDLLWEPILSQMTGSPWFSGYHELLAHAGSKLGTELFKVKDTFYINRARNLQITPLGPDRKKLRGRTDYLCGADELGLFESADNTNKVKMNADEVYKSLSNAMRTVKSAWYKKLRGGYDFILPPIIGAISSPMDKKDKIIRLYESRDKQRRMYAFKYATWEMNPHLKRSDFDDDFATDPQRAQRDFAAMPANSALPWIEFLSSIKTSISKNPNILALKRKVVKVKSAEYYSADPVPQGARDGQRRCMAIDAGMVNNSFSVALGYYSNILHRPIIDAVVELIPDNRIPINFTLLYEDFIRPVIEYYNVALMVADRWQSATLLSNVQVHEGIESEQYSVKYSDFVSLKDDLLVGNISLPKMDCKLDAIESMGIAESYPQTFVNKPMGHLAYQIITVQDTEASVEKGVGSTDDNLRAVALLYSYLVDPKYHALCSGSKLVVEQKRSFIASISSLGVGGGGSAGNTGGGSGAGYISVGSRGTR